jgi:electron-transferring-flavoprotein dehydrogenase
VDIFSGFAASEVLFEGTKVVGVRTGDRGIDKKGQRKATFEPGVDVRAKVTIFCDGVRGNLTKVLVNKLKLDEGQLPQIYAIGIKELWEVPKARLSAGSVITPWAIRCGPKSSAARSSMGCRTDSFLLGSSAGWTIATRCSIRT